MTASASGRERKLARSRMSARASTNAITSGVVVRRRSAKSSLATASPVMSTCSGSSSRSVCTCDSSRNRDGDQGSAVAARDLGLVAEASREALGLVRLGGDEAHGLGCAREGALDVARGDHRGLVGRQARDRAAGLQAQDRRGKGEQREGRDRERRARAAHDEVGQRGPDAAVATGTGHERQAALVDAVAEQGEDRGKHREAADDGDRDDEHRRQRHAREQRDAGEQQAREAGDHRDAGDDDRTADRGRRGIERGMLVPARPALLPLTANVEERVVDAHRVTRAGRRGSTWPRPSA